MTPTTETFKVRTLSFQVNTANPTINPPTKIGRLESKETCQEKALILVASITTKSYEKYQVVNISIKDTKSLKDNLSITTRLQWAHDCWERYDLLDPYNIIFPSKANLAIPEMENGTVEFCDIFTHHMKLTAY